MFLESSKLLESIVHGKRKKKKKKRLKRLTLSKLLLRARICTEAKGTKEDWRSNQFGPDRLFRSRIESASLGKKKKLAEESDPLGIVTICVPPISADSRKKKQKKEKKPRQFYSS